MNFFRNLTIVGFVLFSAAAVHADVGEGSHSGPNPGTLILAIMDMKVTSPDLEPVAGESLSAVLSAQVKAQLGDHYRIISRNDLRALVGQQIEAQELGCDEPGCIADLGKAAAANLMLTSSLGKVGEDWVLTLELFDVEKALVLERQASTWRGEVQGLVELVGPMVSFIFDENANTYTGRLQVVSAQEGALVHIDEEEKGEIPLPPLKDLQIGRHRVKVLKSGYLPFEQDVVVQRNETTLFQVQLIDESTIKPWYTSWWVWGGSAALVAGALTTAYFLQPEDSTSIRVHSPLP